MHADHRFGEESDGMSSYGSFAPRSGVIGREAWQERQDRARLEILETDDTKYTIRKYVLVGVVIAVLVTLACYILMGRVEAQLSIGLRGPHSLGGQGTAGGGAAAGGEAESLSASRRLYIRHLLQGPAAEEARNYAWKQIEDWGRAHPTEPIRNGMLLILQQSPTKYKAIVTGQVQERLTSPTVCKERHSCTANPIADSIRALACPDRVCTSDVLRGISSIARSEARAAVDYAFQTLARKNLGQLADSGGGPEVLQPSSFLRPPPLGASPAAGTAVYGQAAAAGLGYGPTGYTPQNILPHGQRSG